VTVSDWLGDQPKKTKTTGRDVGRQKHSLKTPHEWGKKKNVRVCVKKVKDKKKKKTKEEGRNELS